jgi:predicted nucleic acid-binding protein
MTMYFLDSSAIVKRYFQEQGHDWIETLHDPNQGHVLYTAQVAVLAMWDIRSQNRRRVPAQSLSPLILPSRRGTRAKKIETKQATA